MLYIFLLQWVFSPFWAFFLCVWGERGGGGGGSGCQYTGGWAVLMEDIVIFVLEKEQYKGRLKEKAIQTIKEKTYLPSIPSAFLG